jgi:hypothetical protein
MSGTLVRSIGWQRANSPCMSKSTALLSDGVTRMICVYDANQSGITGDGGDNTGVAKAYFYSSTDGVTWTLRATISAAVYPSFPRPMGSMSIDSANNIHFVWRDSTGGISYNMLTYASGPGYTAGTTSQIANPTGGQLVRLEIDVLGTLTTKPVIAAYWSRTTTQLESHLLVWIRNTTTTWTQIVNETLMPADTRLTYTDDFGLACDQSVIAADNISTFCVAGQRTGTNGTELGDFVRMYEVNTSTNVLVSSVQSPLAPFNKGLGGGYRMYRIFNTATDTFVVTATVGAQPWKAWVYKFSYNRSTNVYTTIVPPTISADLMTNKYYYVSDPNGTYVYGLDRTSVNSDPIAWAAAAWTPANKVLFVGHEYNWSEDVVCTLDDVAGTATFAPNRLWDGNYQPSGGAPPVQMWAGTPRNYSNSIVPVVISYTFYNTNNVYQLQYRQKLGVSTPLVNSPSTGGTVTTDIPTLTAQVKNPENFGQLRVKAQFQLATDAGFTTNIRTITQDNTKFIVADNTQASSFAVVLDSETITAINQLFQGTWYIRVLQIDELGDVGAYSTSANFSVTHPPVGANLYPNSSVILIYGVGNVTFTWTFTDPSPTDSQTAYRVLVENNDTNASVLDSGKITSTIASATLAISSSAKDLNLRWRLTLWDSDDVAGPQSSPQLFKITDGPVPTITGPANLAVLTSGIPTVSWTNGFVAPKTQKAYRITVTQGALTVYTTDWVISTTQSVVIPTGVLTNLNTYTIIVAVRDSTNIEGQASVQVSTSWTPPASRTLSAIYLSEFAKRGFVWVTFDPTSADTDFQGFVIYRRQYGDSQWTVVATSTKLTDIVGIQDYLIGSGVTYEYAMTQVVNRFGDIVESTIVEASKITVTPRADGYWLLDTVVPADSIPLYSVTDDTFTEEYEMETFHVIGRGQHVDYGDRLGFNGSMTAKLRDRALTGTQKINYVTNPALYYANPGPTPNNWVLSGTGTFGTLTEEEIQTKDPHPTGRPTVYRITSTGLGATTADAIVVQQLVLLDGAILTGDTCTFSFWVNDVDADISGRRLEIGIRWETSANALVTDSFTQSPAQVDTYTLNTVGSPDYGNPSAVVGAWKRYSISATRPATATQARLRIQVEGTGTGSTAVKRFCITGAQFEKGSLTPYFDGAQIGSNWIGSSELGTSETSGYYSARNMRLDLEVMKAKRSPIYLRSPFGDIWRVAPGNIGVSRIPGTGQTEFTDVTLPYTEVAF